MSNKQKINVYLRIRPYLPQETPENSENYTQNSQKPTQLKIKEENEEKIQKNYEFSTIFKKENNQQIYENTIKEQIKSKFLKGYNMTLFAYGQTNSGKTHTIFGHQSSEKGIIFQSLQQIFQKKQQKRNIAILISYVEIYNEQIFDLLSENPQNQLKVTEKQGNFYVNQCKEILVNSEQEALEILQQGNKKKTFGYSQLNNKSSRSHTIFKIILGKQNKKTQEKSISELNFVDLAGSECLTDQFGAQQQEETKAINLSLFNLKSVIQSLSQNENYIPYRQSLLTKLLSNSLGGNSSTSIICTISPCSSEYKTSKRTIQFGQIAKKIENSLQQNILKFSEKTHKIVVKSNPLLKKIKIQEKNIQKSIKTAQNNNNNYENMEEIMVLDPNIPSLKNKTCLNCLGNPENPIALFLHCLGGQNYAGKQCMPYLFQPLAEAGFYVVAPDLPGYGKSQGEKFSSRITENREKIINFLDDLLFYLQNQQKSIQKSIILGYDFGASAALHYGSSPNSYKKVSQMYIFHPSWNKSSPMEILQKIKAKVTLLWVNTDQFHSIQIGEQMNKIIPNSSLIKLDCGKFNSEKSKGNYACIASQVEEQVLKNLLPSQNPQQNNQNQTLNSQNLNQLPQKNLNQQTQQQQNEEGSQSSEDEGTVSSECVSLLEVLQNRTNPESDNFLKFGSACVRGKIEKSSQNKQNLLDLQKQYEHIVPKITTNCSKEDNTLWAVQRFKQLLLTGEIEDYYKAYLTNNALKPQAVKIFGNLPILRPHSDLKIFEKYDIFGSKLTEKLKKNFEILQNIPEFHKNKKVFVETQVQANIFKENFMNYDKKSQDKYLTYKATIDKYDPQNKIFSVKLPSVNQNQEILEIKQEKIFQYNKGTNFQETSKDEYLFEDGVKCKYSDFFTRAKILEAALSISDILEDINLESETPQKNLQNIQKCTERLQSNIDLIHLVKEGIDPNRYCSTDCGKLAYYGQGTCHILASVVCAFLLPFTKLLGLDVKFRAGFLPKKQRDIDENKEMILQKWNGKPRFLEDHTWVEVSYKLSPYTYVIDTSFGYFNIPIDFLYSEHELARQYISKNTQCNSLPQKTPENLFTPKNEEIEKIISKFDQNIEENLIKQGINQANNPVKKLECPEWQQILSEQLKQFKQ